MCFGLHVPKVRIYSDALAIVCFIVGCVVEAIKDTPQHSKFVIV
jgi:hypothetical protein